MRPRAPCAELAERLREAVGRLVGRLAREARLEVRAEVRAGPCGRWGVRVGERGGAGAGPVALELPVAWGQLGLGRGGFPEERGVEVDFVDPIPRSQERMQIRC